jgi:putative hydrolase of the HAD superfamily
METAISIKVLFVDIGGVLLTDGWGREFRARAAREFGLDSDEMEERHHQAFEAYEVDAIGLDQYLDLVVFHRERSFTMARFREYMFAESRPIPRMIGLVKRLKAEHGLKVVALSNEGRELNEHRIRTFQLDEVVDFFVSSCYVGLRKPDPKIFRLALDTCRIPAENVAYLENTPMFVEIAKGMGIHGILHVDFDSTRLALASLGLPTGEDPPL